MDGVADALDAAADALSRAGRTLPDVAVPAEVFGADDAGRPGLLGRALHARFDGVLAARSTEAADTGARLAGIAEAVRRTARSYDQADEAAARRLRQVP
jgi:hypothetical protein